MVLVTAFLFHLNEEENCIKSGWLAPPLDRSISTETTLSTTVTGNCLGKQALLSLRLINKFFPYFFYENT